MSWDYDLGFLCDNFSWSQKTRLETIYNKSNTHEVIRKRLPEVVTTRLPGVLTTGE